MEDVGQQVRWGLVLIVVQDGPPLASFQEMPMEKEGIAPVQEDNAIAVQEDSAAVE